MPDTANENIYYVYIHRRNDTNEVFYVGKGKGKRSSTIHNRNQWWNRIVDKHGFSWEIIEKELFEDDAFDLEIELIKFYRDCGCELVNMTDGGEGVSGHIKSPETRAALSAAHKGRVKPQWWREKIGAAHKGKTLSEETRQKLREHNLGKKSSQHAIDARRRSWIIPVKCSNGMTFESAAAALVWLKSEGHTKKELVSASGITQCCKGNNKSSYGFGWAYLTEEKESQMSNEQEMVTIAATEYDRLLDDSEWLSYLKAAGVDNWEGYDYARELQQEANGDNE